MAWTVEFSTGAERQLLKLVPDTARRLALYLRKLVAETTDPRERGKALLILSAQVEAAPLQLSRPLQDGTNACR